MSVQSILIVVDLPAPLGPRKPNTSPGRDLEVDAAHGLDLVVVLAQAAHPDGGRAAISISRGGGQASSSGVSPSARMRYSERLVSASTFAASAIWLLLPARIT